MARRVLVVYGTSYGQTAKIARRIAAVLIASGDRVMLRPADDIPPGTTPQDFDGVVVGASVVVGRHQRAARRFARRHRAALNDMPSAFFSVSASAASFDEQGRSRARECSTAFLRDTGWYPPLTESIAGAIKYPRYNPIVRWLMRRICAQTGGPTDTSRDHELTDWAQVDRFATSFGALMARSTHDREAMLLPL
jgi:menaquinone-dependent protoporphyrinogen oxidase